MNLSSPTVPGATEPSERVQRAPKRAKLDDEAACERHAGASGRDDVSVSQNLGFGGTVDAVSGDVVQVHGPATLLLDPPCFLCEKLDEHLL